MKILYHHRTRGDGAEGVHIREMGDAFVELGHEVEYCCPKAAKREPGLVHGMTGMTAADRAGVSGWVKLRVRQSAEIFYNLVSFTRLMFAIRRFKPELIYERYSCYHFAGVLAAKICRIPILLEVNSTLAGRFPRRVLAFPRLTRWIENFDVTHASGVAVVSEPLRECVLDRGVESCKVVVTPNAINSNSVTSFGNVESVERIRSELGLTGKVVIGFVGSLRRWHGVEMMVRQIPNVLRQHAGVSFLIVGGGELEDQIRQFEIDPTTKGRVVFTGGVQHSRALECVSAMDIGLMPHSNTWGSPMKILEYMAMGKVTIAPRLAPIEEIVQDGVTGMLFEPENEDAFLATMLRAVNDAQARERIGTAAAKYVLAERKWTDNARKVLSVLQVANPS